jgi:predicted nucleotide-binding protein
LTVPCDNDEQSADWFCLKGFQKVKPDPSCWAIKAPKGFEGDALPKGHIDAAREAQCVIVVGGANGTYAAGMTAIYRRTLILPVGSFGGAAEDLLSALRLRHDHILKSAIFSGALNNLSQVVEALIREVNGHPRLLIVHGRSKDRESVRAILHNNFKDLHRPVILDHSGSAAVALSNKFASLAGTCTGAIVIATPDDIGASVLDGTGNTLGPGDLMKFGPRARENVWIEMGWLWAGLGRNRIMMLVKGETGVPSDIQDTVRAFYQNDPIEVQAKILDFVGGMQQGDLVVEA